MNDPVFEKDGKWYFWDETWAYEYGPYSTEEEARFRLDLYVELYLNVPDLRV